MSSDPSPQQATDFLIITTLHAELQALLKILPSPTKRIQFDTSNTLAYSADFPIILPNGITTVYHIVIMQSGGIGRINAAIVTTNAIRQWLPRYILLVGVAGGVARGELHLGDVLIADQIIDYEQQKITSEGAQPRWEVYRADTTLLSSAQHVASGTWPKNIKAKPPSRQKIRSHIGPVASGDKIIASSSELAKLLKHWPRLIGVEREGGGVAAAIANLPSAPGLLMIRGVADIVDDLKGGKEDDWIELAGSAAAAFTVALLSNAPIKPSELLPAPQSLRVDTHVNSPETSSDTPLSDQYIGASSDVSVSELDTITDPSLLLVPLRTRLAGYDADSSVGTDLLDIGQDVDAFASLIAAHTTPPPLSIGLFGEWGYGKTFFMRQVKQRIAQLASDARASGRLQKEIAYYKRIVQIEFNAWHYVEGNLWASLIEHILFNLHVADSPQDEAQTLQSKILLELGVQARARADIETSVQLVKDELAAIEREIANKTKELDEASERIQTLNAVNILATVMALPETQADVEKLNGLRTDLGLPTVSAAIDDMEAAISEAEAVVSRSTALLMPLVSAPDRVRRLIWLVILLLAGPAIGLIVAWLVSMRGSQWIAQVSALLTTFTAWLYMIIGALRRASRWVSERVGKIERVKRHLESRIKSEQAKIRDQISELEQQRMHLGFRYAEQQQALAATQERVERLEEDLRHATPAHLLTKFIQDRVESTDYRKHLGVLALVRQDFERMSRFIEAENKRITSFQTIQEEEYGLESRINRIVLYIDDLDRCPADKVIQVLEAVHLLLAFPLFVVVVAVDARWVSGALNEEYGALLGGADKIDNNNAPSGKRSTATPIDYLEKIFQIPFWLSPMSQPARKRMIEGLLASSLAQDGGATSVGEISYEHLSDMENTESDSNDSTSIIQDVEVIEAAEEVATDLNPDALIVQPAELAFINELSPLLGRSPRALKRFVNIYRLIKSGVSETEHAAFDPSAGEKAEFKVAMFLLAIVTNNPDHSQRFFAALSKQLRERRTENTLNIQDWEKLLSLVNSENNPEWIPIKIFLQSAAAIPIRTMSVKKLTWWARRVARFSFHIEPNLLES